MQALSSPARSPRVKRPRNRFGPRALARRKLLMWFRMAAATVRKERLGVRFISASHDLGVAQGYLIGVRDAGLVTEKQCLRWEARLRRIIDANVTRGRKAS